MPNTTQEQQEQDTAAELVERIGNGERLAESMMVQRYGRGLLYLLLKKTGDQALADDLYQDTFRIAIEKLRAGELRNPRALPGFLRSIANNLVIGHYRRERRRATDCDADAVQRVAVRGGQFRQQSRKQVGAVVRHLLDELTVPRDREILMRYYLDDQDKDIICAELGLDSRHFNRVLFRAKRRFKELLIQAERRNRLKIVPAGQLAREALSQGGEAH